LSRDEPNGRGSKVVAILIIVVIVQAVLLGFTYWQFTGLSNHVAQIEDNVALGQSQRQNQTQSMENALQSYLQDLLNSTSLPNGGLFAITTAYATGSGPWNVTLIGLNLQKASVTVTQVLVGGTPFTGFVAPYILPLTFQPWTTFHISFILDSGSGGSYSGGMSVPVQLGTSSGSSYSTTAVLPPSDPQQGEKLVVSAYQSAGATPDLVVSVTNSGSSTVSLTQVTVDGIPVPSAFYSVDFGGAFTGRAPWGLAPGATGTFSMYYGEVIGPSPCGMGFIDGMTYPVNVLTAAGTSFPSAISWP